MNKKITIPTGTTLTFYEDTKCEICKQVIGVNVPLKAVVNYDEVIGWVHASCIAIQSQPKVSEEKK